MKLWLITPKEGLSSDDNPWYPWYNKCFGMVIRAETEEEARELATDDSCDECETTNYGCVPWTRKDIYKNAWRYSRYSDCVELEQDGEAKTILMDVRSA